MLFKERNVNVGRSSFAHLSITIGVQRIAYTDLDRLTFSGRALSAVE
jgi:hypothetical protein